MKEFGLIDHFTQQHHLDSETVWLGPGDDCAGISAAANDYVMTIDSLVVGTHFTEAMPAQALGHKAAAVSLSDVAAMGAQPLWALCALSMPTIDPEWCESFRCGFHGLLEAFSVSCVGGDVTSGALAVTSQLTGQVDRHHALRRSGARPGDHVYISGDLGQSKFAYDNLNVHADESLVSFTPAQQRCFEHCLKKLYYPTPRVALGQALVGQANACLDVSDGLVADLSHLCRASDVGILLNPNNIPIAKVLLELINEQEPHAHLAHALHSGDEYELCFTAPAVYQQKIYELANQCQVPITQIGEVVSGHGIDWYPEFLSSESQYPSLDLKQSWQHF